MNRRINSPTGARRFLRSGHPARIIAFLGLLSCGDQVTAPGAGIPASLDIIAGQDQSGVVGTALATPLRVQVLDINGNPVSGQAVNFKVLSGGGSTFAGVEVTTSTGIAVDHWTLGTSTADSQRVEARAVDSNTGARLVFGTFRAIALPDAPAALTKVAGDAQSGPVGSALTDSLAVKVVDKYGNPVPRTSVTWSVPSGGGSVLPTTSQTDSLGIARTKWTIGINSATAQSVTASLGQLTPAQFSASISGGQYLLAPAPSTIVAGTTLSITAQLATQAGAAVPTSGLTVTWSAPRGRFAAATSTTNASGVAAVQYTADTVAANATSVTATDGNHATGSTTLTTAPAAAAKIAFLIQPANTGWSVVFASPPQVAVEDVFGNVVTSSSAQISLALATNPGGATLTGGGAVPATGGIASFATAMLDAPGVGYSLRANVASGSLPPVTSNAFNVSAVGTIVTFPDSLTGIVLRGSTVFFAAIPAGGCTSQRVGRIVWLPVTGGTTTAASLVAALASSDDHCSNLGLLIDDGTYVNSLFRVGFTFPFTTIRGVTTDGLSRDCCTSNTDDLGTIPPSEFDFDGSFFYDTEQDQKGLTQYPVMRVFRESGAGVRKILYSRTQTDFLSPMQNPFVRVANGQVYFTDSTTATGIQILKVQSDSGAASVVASGIGPLESRHGGALAGWRKMIVIGSNIYWAEVGSIKSAPITGGAPVLRAGGLAAGIGGFRTDGNFLYFVAGGSIQRMSLTDFSISTVVANDNVADIDLDANAIYWTSNGVTRTVKKTHK